MLTFKQSETRTTFRLLDLPSELRLRIYEYAVTSEHPVKITYHNDGYGMWYSQAAIARRTQPALTRASKEIRVDAIKLYYTRNDFEAGYCVSKVGESKTLMEWLECIGAVNRGFLRVLKISDCNSGGVDNDVCMEGGEVEGGGCRADLVRLGAVVEAVDGKFPTHMVSFPRAKTEQ